MASEMIERVARAIAESLGCGYGWHNYVDEARAAIQAMREPTEAMIDAGMVVPSRILVRDCWDSMIEEAMRKTTDGE